LGSGLPRLELELRCLAGVLVSKSSGDDGVVLVDRGVAVVLWASRLHKSIRDGAVVQARESGGPMIYGGEGL
jgi:hypothetical protein